MPLAAIRFAALRKEDIVSLMLVTDPFFYPPLPALEQHFDKVMAYKEHYLNDFRDPQLYDSKNHHQVPSAFYRSSRSRAE
jgi:hypothetical protein